MEMEMEINQTFIDGLVKRFKVIGFDADWTLWQPRVGQGKGNIFRKDPFDVQWMPGRKEVLQMLYSMGVRLFIATNQGLTSFLPIEAEAEQFIRYHLRASEILAGDIGPAVRTYHCFTYPPVDYKSQLEKYVSEGDFMRKPNPGMLFTAMSDFEIANVQDALYVGDRMEDERAAQNAGVHFLGADAFFEQAYRRDKNKNHTSDTATN
jgi:HAD superfamily hydrolase (TIGR01662 family)